MTRRVSVLLFICAVALPAAASAAVRITEVMYDTDGSDSKHEWVEIYNEGPDAANLAPWKFVDSSKHDLNVPPKNGGLGSMLLAPGRYAVLTSDAATFAAEYPGLSIVIDTVMSLNNSGATIGLKNGNTVVDTMSYTKAMGAADDGDSLQLNGSVWIAAAPTPGKANATTPSVHEAAAPAPKKIVSTAPKTKSKSTATTAASSKSNVEDVVSNDPLAVVNATATDEDLTQTAAAGVLGGSAWWLAAGALAIGSGAAASLISRSKKNEWDIEEAE